MATSTTNFNLTKPADTDPVDIVTLEGDNMDKIDAAMQDNKTPTFNDYNSSESGMPSESQALTNIKSKATLSILFQNIKAYLKKACTVGQLVTNCTSSSNTLPLAASQGKVLQDQITTLNRNTSNLESRLKIITSGSFKDISKSGIYYVTNAVQDKPDGTGGLYLLSFYDEGINIGLYISANQAINPIVCAKNEEVYRIQKA